MIITQQRTTSDTDARHESGSAAGGERAEAMGEALRSAMRQTASTVAVVTARGSLETRGVTVSTLVMVSLDPPLVSFSLQRHSQMEAVLSTAERYAVHILDSDQAGLARRFATRGRSAAEQFAGLASSEHGAPRLPGALAILTCEPHAGVKAGDHVIVVGRVIDVESGDGSAPLLYHDRAYHRVGEPAEPAAD